MEKVVPDRLKIEHISRSTVQGFLQVVFIVFPSGGRSKYIETEVQSVCFYLI